MASGAIAVGSAIVSFVGGTAAVAALGTTLVGMIGGAVIGAAVGGLTAAITGGDIGEGVLFGAIGGAVAGGIGGYFAEGSTALTASGDAVSVGGAGASSGIDATAASAAAEQGVNSGTQLALAEGSYGVAGETAAQASGGFFSQVGSFLGDAGNQVGSFLGDAGKEALVSGIKDFAVAGFQSSAAKEKMQKEQELAMNKLKAEQKMAQERLAAEERIAKMKIDASAENGGGGGGDAAQVAEINAASALAVAKERSASVRDQIADAKSAREEGYLKEDEKRDRMRDSTKGMLVSKKRVSSAPAASDNQEGVDKFENAPDTPNYVAKDDSQSQTDDEGIV